MINGALPNMEKLEALPDYWRGRAFTRRSVTPDEDHHHRLLSEAYTIHAWSLEDS